MDESNGPSAGVSSEEKLNLPPRKFFVTVVVPPDSFTSQHAGKLSGVHVALSGFIHLLCVH